MHNEDQPKSNKQKTRDTKFILGNPHGEEKPSNIFSIDSIDNDTMPIQMPKSETLDAKSNPSAKP